jgi:hypothetical protein
VSSARRPPLALAALAGLVGLGLVGLAGCPTFADGDYVFREEFEGPYCDGAPCGWARLSGPEDAAYVDEPLAGEHALFLDGSGVVVRVEPAASVEDLGDSTLALDLVARCDVGSTLVVEIGATESFSGAVVELTPPLVQPRNVLNEWGQPRPTAVALGDGRLVLRSIDSLTITKSGDGVCEIASIGIFRQFGLR